ncbi:hypothetical protein TrRE_jg5882 [Triparma retinervis]|uniref:Uncharacterized protein n=1 Tax=Triparma retinervis TaxID=2557542 RepID=A0A9W6ZBW0_9STRA|nr:hypothetical protein TrRE_jg5882 [Triparma retinervis]
MADEEAAKLDRKKKLEAKLRERREKKKKAEEEKNAETVEGGEKENSAGEKAAAVVNTALGLQHAVNKFMRTKRRVGGVKAKAFVAKEDVVESEKDEKKRSPGEEGGGEGHEEQLEGAMQALQVALVDHDLEALLQEAGKGGEDTKVVQIATHRRDNNTSLERPKTTPGKERRKTRQERLVAWTPSPEKKTRLGSMYRGVPVNAKPETILQTKFTPLKSDAVLLQNIQRDHGMNVSYRRKTSQPSNANIRRLLDFVKDKRSEAEKNWKGTKEGKKELRRVKSKKSLKELAFAEG